MRVDKEASVNRRGAMPGALLAIAAMTAIATIATSGSPVVAGFSALAPAHTRGTAQPGPGGAQPLENGPATEPRPLYSTRPSDRVDNDPHWRSPNVRANTD